MKESKHSINEWNLPTYIPDEWNQTEKDFPDTVCIHELFEQQVNRTPDGIAEIYQGDSITYRELNRRANILAKYLQAKGVKPEVLVGVYVERSIEMVIGLLGVLKAGGAYVPLDPTYPKKRLSFMIEESSPLVMLTQRKLLESLPSHQASVICLDAQEDWLHEDLEDNPVSNVTPDNAAYIIFTSGSTGRPKGVIGLHRGMINRISWMWQELPYESEDICCQKASLSFVDSVGEIFSPLLCGVPTLIIPDNAIKDPYLLVDILERQDVTRITMVPTLLRMILNTVEDLQDRLPKLKYWFSSGEALPYDLERLFFSRMQANLYNLYGPTEASIEVTYWPCERENPYQKVLIGKPIFNTKMYILGANLKPVPIGVIGDLYIGGIGLARGYLNAPELTQKKFIPNPFSEQPDERIYKTDDLARYLPDGNIEFCGRHKNQVKIRGFRIELGEIEAALLEHPSVRESAVIAREIYPGHKHLIGFIVISSTKPTTVGEILTFLKTKLPEFMVPSILLTIEELPRTPNGKLNRLVLPTPEPEMFLAAQDIVPAQTDDEITVAQIFANVLHLPIVGVNNSFFDLGGNSLLATQVVSRLRDTFSVELTLTQFFSEPTVAGLLPQLLKGDLVKVLTPPILPSSQQGDAPLSFAQERLYFLEQMEDLTSAYYTPIILRIEGDLDTAILNQTLNKIIQRHEILRTVFLEIDGANVQRVQPFEPLELPFFDLIPHKGKAQEQAIEELIKEQHNLPFDLAQDSLVRVSLLKIDAQIHFLALTLHHIVFDGWSLKIFLEELATIYQALTAETLVSLPELLLQYSDYSRWQRSWLQGEAIEEHVEYWDRQLTGAPPLLEFPLDRPRPPRQSFRGRTEGFTLNPELVSKLEVISKQAETTLYMTFLAAYATLLSRYSGQDDLCIGSPVANRNRSEIEPLIGCFINTLVMRIQLSQAGTFSQLLQHVRQVTLEAYDHQDLPFEELVRILCPERNLSHAPLFQVMFALEEQEPPVELTNLSFIPVDVKSEHSLFDLSLTIKPTDNGLQGVFEYSCELFDAATISRLATHYQRLLEEVVTMPEMSLSQIDFLTTAERWELEVALNQTTVDFSPHQFVHELFAEQVELNPEAVALVFGRQRVTYRELNARANRVAHYLRSQGIKPEQVVGICLERSIAMVEAIIGVLKAGGAYLPLDSEYPDERLAHMLKSSQATVLLTQKSLAGKLLGHDAKTILIEVAESEGSDQEIDATEIGLKANNLAYVIYTSGSTGTPKGVMITHHNLTNAYKSWNKAYGLSGRCTSHLQMASFSFDVFTGDVVRALCSGAQLVLVSRDTILSPSALYAVMRQESIDCADFTPGVLRNLAQYLDATGQDLSFLKLIVIGSDSWNVSEYRKWRSLCGAETRFINAYGVTEATVASSYFEETQQNLQQVGSVPIGGPLPNIRLYILDQHRQTVPIGVAGELYIGGAGVGRGYLNQPELTEKSFIKDIFSDCLGDRLYKTGDIVRRLADGNIKFLGRRDNQVKIRGFRIELGEIEETLTQHLSVREAVVLAQADQTGSSQLSAYIVPSGEVSPSAADLREFLKQCLPMYMLPSRFVVIPAFPLTPNGKVDQRALASSGSFLSDSDHKDSFVLPRNPQEEVLVAIWCEILNLNRISIYDNFFELGGHSLLATQVISRIQETFLVKMSVSSLFEASSIAELAERVQKLRSKSVPQTLSPLQPFPREADNAPLSFAQQRLWFLSQIRGMNVAYNILLKLDFQGDLQVYALEQSLVAIIQRHEVLRTRFLTIEGTPLQQILPSLSIVLKPIDLTSLAENEQDTQINYRMESESEHSFDLEEGHLIRATLFKRSPTSHILLLALHHIIADAWSVGILLKELSINYESLTRGDTSPLRPLPVQYADFVHWQRSCVEETVLQEQLHYWIKQLEDASPLLELPTDRPRLSQPSYRGSTEQFLLDEEFTSHLQKLGRRFGASLYMILLSAWAILLGRYSGQQDICIGSPIANRGRTEIEELIGFFVNTLVMRVHWEGNPRFSELLAQVRRISLDAYDHQDLPFERLVEILKPDRTLSYAPLFQVMFALHNTPTREIELDGLTINKTDVFNSTAKFDLVLEISEVEKHLVGQLEYNSDLFDRDTIKRMVCHYQTLLQAIAANPEECVESLPLLTSEEQQHLLANISQTQADFPDVRCMQHLFEAQAEQIPHQVAIISPSELDNPELTYQELNNRANHLAYYLQSLGVGPEVLVGICIERSLMMLITVLAVWKAGGAYVPLDPAYPQERLHFMLEDSQAAVLLTQKTIVLDVPATTQVVFLDDFPLGDERLENPHTKVTPENLVYITYTSGSTGKPKGIAMTHRAVSNLIAWQVATSLVTPKAKTLQFAPLSFDVSFQEIMATWHGGGTLVLISEKERRDPSLLLDLLKTRRIQRLFLPTAALQPLAVAGMYTEELPRDLREVWVGGEQMQITPEIKHLFSVLTHCRLYNYYGPSECHAVTAAPLAEDVNHWPMLPSIGKPIPNTPIYILDKYQKPVPIGVTGEIYIGGNCLARGYLNRPELTQEKFIPDPFSKDIEARLYRTGDLAHYLADGSIEYEGRSDRQVKFRGFRIETTEIESVITQHEDICTAVSMVREEINGSKSLVAYVVLNEGRLLNANNLKSHLQQQLPDYMIPSTFIPLEELPLTANGKIDQAILRQVAQRYTTEQNNLMLPRNTLELEISRIWEDILNIKAIGMMDNFFDLGGHSLLAMNLIAKIQELVGKKISVEVLFQAPTIAQLADRLQSQIQPTSWSCLVGIQTTGSKPPLFCVHPVGGNVLCYAALSRCLPEQPFYGLQALGFERGQNTLQTIEEIASYYVQSLRKQQPEGPYYLSGWSMGGIVAYEMAQQLTSQGHNVPLLVLIDSHVPTAQDQIQLTDTMITAALTKDLEETFGCRLLISTEILERLNFEEQVNHLLSQAKAANLLPQHLSYDDMCNLLKVFRSNLEASAHYRPQKYSGKVVVIAAEDCDWEVEEVFQNWKNIPLSQMETYSIPGNHYTIIRPPKVKHLATILEQLFSRKNGEKTNENVVK